MPARPKRLLSGLLLGASVLTVSANSEACGASSGASGVAVCSVVEEREKLRKKWHVAAGYTFTDTRIVLKSGEDKVTLDQSRQSVLAVGEWRATPRLSLQAGAGALVSGGFRDGGARFEFEPGFASLLGASGVLVRPKGAVPFVLGTAQFSSLFASTAVTSTADSAKYRAFDLRLGAAVGWTFFSALSPYAIGRVFGGPIRWELSGTEVTGTDLYKYQLGAGLSVLAFGSLDFYVEGIALGERGISAGLGVTF